MLKQRVFSQLIVHSMTGLQCCSTSTDWPYDIFVQVSSWWSADRPPITAHPMFDHTTRQCHLRTW